jgi:hypothetical protein
MFSCELHDDMRSTSRFIQSEGKLRYVTIEMPTEQSRLPGAILDKVLLSSAVHELHEVAASLGQYLANGGSGSSEWAFFAGVDLSDTDVTCCVSGPHRVHLIQGGELVASTREHTLEYDGPPPDWPSLSVEDLSSLAHVVVRSIGCAVSTPPERTRWPVPGPCQVVIASADFYGAEPPSAYVLSVSAKLRSPERITGSCALLTRM